MSGLQCASCDRPVDPHDQYCPHLDCRQQLLLARGRYRLLRRLGKPGGFGIVYEAVDHNLSEMPEKQYLVAIKKLPENYYNPNEWRVLRDLSPKLEPRFTPLITDVLAEDNYYYIVMELIDGPTLAIEKDDPPWSIAAVHSFLSEMLNNLDKLHKLNIFHRDIKPTNIKQRIDNDRYVLIDFGLVRRGDILHSHGYSPGYSSPEQFHRLQTDAKSDLYSLGATAYYLLTKRVPPPADQRELQDLLQPVKKYITAIPDELNTLIWAMLKINPNERPQSADISRKWLENSDISITLDLRDSGTSGADDGDVMEPSPDTRAFLELARCGKGRITSLTWSRDGQQLAVGTALGVYLFDMQRIEQEHAFPEAMVFTQSRPVAQVVFSDNQFMVIATTDGQAYFWSLKDGQRQVVAGETTLPQTIFSTLINPAGDCLICVTDRGISLWPFGTGATVQHLRESSEGVAIKRLAWSPNGRLLALPTLEGVQVLRANDGAKLQTLPVHPDNVGPIAITPDGQTIAIVVDSTIQRWRIDIGQPLRPLEGYTGHLRRLIFSPDGRSLVATGDDAVYLWHVNEHKEPRRFDGYVEHPTGVVFAPNNERFAIVSGKNVTLQSAVTKSFTILGDHSSDIFEAAFAPEGNLLATASSDSVKIWNVDEGSLICALSGHWSNVYSSAFDSNSQKIAVLSDCLEVYRIGGGGSFGNSRMLMEKVDEPGTLAFSSSGRFLALGAGQAVHLWTLDEQLEQVRAEIDAGRLCSTMFSESDETACAASTKNINFFSPTNGQLLQQFNIKDEDVFDVVLSNDGQSIALISGRSVLVRSISGGLRLRLDEKRLELDRDNIINDVSLSGGGELLAVATSCSIQVWQVTAKRRLTWLDVGGDRVVLSPDSRFLVTTHDNIIQLWRFHNEEIEEINRFDGHTDFVNDIMFSPKKSQIVSASRDGTVRLWMYDPRLLKKTEKGQG